MRGWNHLLSGLKVFLSIGKRKGIQNCRILLFLGGREYFCYFKASPCVWSLRAYSQSEYKNKISTTTAKIIYWHIVEALSKKTLWHANTATVTPSALPSSCFMSSSNISISTLILHLFKTLGLQVIHSDSCLIDSLTKVRRPISFADRFCRKITMFENDVICMIDYWMRYRSYLNTKRKTNTYSNSRHVWHEIQIDFPKRVHELQSCI